MAQTWWPLEGKGAGRAWPQGSRLEPSCSNLALGPSQCHLSNPKPFRDFPLDPEKTADHPTAQKADQDVNRNELLFPDKHLKG